MLLNQYYDDFQSLDITTRFVYSFVLAMTFILFNYTSLIIGMCLSGWFISLRYVPMLAPQLSLVGVDPYCKFFDIDFSMSILIWQYIIICFSIILIYWKAPAYFAGSYKPTDDDTDTQNRPKKKRKKKKTNHNKSNT